ncbi:MAG TPA: hypothetical protein VD858_04180, partial [Reyranella sp.]|nr:hypothetical protein [Reyranella sp.]
MIFDSPILWFDCAWWSLHERPSIARHAELDPTFGHTERDELIPDDGSPHCIQVRGLRPRLRRIRMTCDDHPLAVWDSTPAEPD